MSISVHEPGADVRKARRRAEAVELREQGLTYREIGQRVGVTHPAAVRYVQDAMAAYHDRSAAAIEALVRRDNADLDTLRDGLLERMSNEGMKESLVLAFIRVMERRARLNGLDATGMQTSEADIRVSFELAPKRVIDAEDV